jgi:ubiquinone/menaquinone biosynthesis C-methylase UbiE
MCVDALQENEKGLVDRAAILEHWKVRHKRVLDLGAGQLTIIAARDFDCTVTTVEINAEKREEANREVEAEGLQALIAVEYGDARSLSYPDRSFEVVIGYGLLHHLEPADREKCIREAVRVASELTIFAELNADGFKKIHEFDEFTPVDLAWLERALVEFGELERYYGRLMHVYVVSR